MVPPSRTLLIGLVVAGALAVAAGRLLPAADVTAGLGDTLVRADLVAGALAMLAGTVAVIRFRVDGYAPACWIGLALLAVGVPSVVATSGQSIGSAHNGAALVAVVFLGVALASPEVSSGLSFARGLVVGAIGVAVATAALHGTESIGWSEQLINTAVAVLFAIVACTAQLRLRRRPRSTWPGLVCLAGGLAIASAVAALIDTTHPMHSGGAALLRFTTMAIVFVCVVSDLHAASALQRRLAFESKTRLESAEQEARRMEKRFAETMHEVRSTVLALEGGVRRLEVRAPASYGTTQPADPDLATALVAEIARLRDLVSDVPDQTARTRYSVRRALEPMLTVSAAGGWPVRWDLPPELEAAGSPADLAQVVHCLLVNATRYAAGTDIEVTARADGDIVQIWVDDHGPGVPHAMRERIFHRGARAVPDQQEAGRGLGLFIARSLMRDEGGDLWAETRPGGGARFIVALPAGTQDATLVDESVHSQRIAPRPTTRPLPAGERRSVRSS